MIANSLKTEIENPIDAGKTIARDVANVLRAMNRAGLEYALLRGFAELSAEKGDLEIDLLINPAHLADLKNTLQGVGFAQFPSWGHEPHLFFAVYDKTRGGWLKLDVVTDLVYGAPVRWLRLNLAKTCLANRLLRDDIYTLCPADEFFTLLIHCLLDKGVFREHRQRELWQLNRVIKTDATQKTRVDDYFFRFLGNLLNRESALAIIEQNDKLAIVAIGEKISQKLFAAAPLQNRLRKLTVRLKRKLRPLLFFLKHRGFWVALMAPDGGGKSTLAKTLLRQPLLRPKLVYMGTNVESSTIGLPTSKWLRKQYKYSDGKPKSFGVKIVKLLVYPNRVLELYFRAFVAIVYRLSGHTVIFDRFVYDSFLAKPANGMGKKIRRWLLHGGVPHADVTYFLDAPGEVLFRRKKEHSPEALERQRQTFLGLQRRIPNMKIVDATQSPEVVQREVLGDIFRLFYGRARVTREKP